MPALTDENSCGDIVTLDLTYSDLSPPPSWVTVNVGPPVSLDYDGTYTNLDVGFYYLRVTGTDDNCVGSSHGFLSTFYEFGVTIELVNLAPYFPSE